MRGKFTALFGEDDAVSPVIGVILMVAVTVILAAVVATFVLGLAEQVSDSAPNASFEFEVDQDAGGEDVTDSWGVAGDHPNVDLEDATLLTITHTGGPNVDASLLGATGSSPEEWISDDDAFADGGTYGDFGTATETNFDRMSAGQSVDIWIDDADSINVVWENEAGTQSARLQSFDGPDA